MVTQPEPKTARILLAEVVLPDRECQHFRHHRPEWVVFCFGHLVSAGRRSATRLTGRLRGGVRSRSDRLDNAVQKPACNYLECLAQSNCNPIRYLPGSNKRRRSGESDSFPAGSGPEGVSRVISAPLSHRGSRVSGKKVALVEKIEKRSFRADQQNTDKLNYKECQSERWQLVALQEGIIDDYTFARSV